MLQTNGYDYEVLSDAIENIKGVPGLTCEVGLREGGGSQIMIDALLDNEDFGRTHITIDPYGSLPYVQSEANQGLTHGEGLGPYPDEMMSQVMIDLYSYVHGKQIKLLFFPLEDTEFFARYGGGVPIYQNGTKEIVNQYACVFIDGPHSTATTLAETVFFADRSVPGSVIVYDDVVNYYYHDQVSQYLLSNGWRELLVAPSKISYVKK